MPLLVAMILYLLASQAARTRSSVLESLLPLLGRWFGEGCAVVLSRGFAAEVSRAGRMVGSTSYPGHGLPLSRAGRVLSWLVIIGLGWLGV